MAEADAVLAAEVPWAETRALWRARLDRVADRFIDGRDGRRRRPPRGAGRRGQAACPSRLHADGQGRPDRHRPKGRCMITTTRQGHHPARRSSAISTSSCCWRPPSPGGRGSASCRRRRWPWRCFSASAPARRSGPPRWTRTRPKRSGRSSARLIAAYMDPERGFTARRAPDGHGRRRLPASGALRANGTCRTDAPDPKEVADDRP